MKLREKFRRFWTMDVHNHEGFTLVELIIVIAILAILSGVAVVGYSSYVEKASKQADMTLISEIANVLTLAGYDGEFDNGEGNYLILSVDGVKNAADIEGTNLDDVLTAAYGDNWANVLTLKYGSWGNNRLYYGLANGGAEFVVNSTYYGVSDKLMGQVEQITDAALNILGVVSDGTPTRDQMIAMFATDEDEEGNSAFLDGVAGMYGYDDLSQVSDAELPNLLVLAVAADITFAEANGTSTVGSASGLIEDFALYNGYAATEQGKADGFDKAYADFVKSLENAQGVSDVAAAYKALQAATKDTGYDAYAAGQGQTDTGAFKAMMSGLTSATIDTNAELTKNDLGNNNFFTTGVGNSLFGTYIDSVEAFAGIQFENDELLEEFYAAMDEEGVVGIFFSCLGNYVVINNSLPVD